MAIDNDGAVAEAAAAGGGELDANKADSDAAALAEPAGVGTEETDAEGVGSTWMAGMAATLNGANTASWASDSAAPNDPRQPVNSRHGEDGVARCTTSDSRRQREKARKCNSPYR